MVSIGGNKFIKKLCRNRCVKKKKINRALISIFCELGFIFMGLVKKKYRNRDKHIPTYPLT